MWIELVFIIVILGSEGLIVEIKRCTSCCCSVVISYKMKNLTRRNAVSFLISGDEPNFGP